MKILIVNNEYGIRRLLSKYFEEKEHKVISVSTGEKAIELIKKKHFDFVMLDIVMPGISGIEVLDKIKEISPETKVIMMSGIFNRDLINKVKKKGAYRYIQKPFKIEDLEKIFANL